MGDVLGPAHVEFDFGHGVLEFLKIGTGLDVFFAEQIAHPAGLFHDDGQRVVDFMGHAGGKFSQGRHLARLGEGGVKGGFFPITLDELANGAVGDKDGSANDKQGTAGKQENEQPAGPVQGQEFLGRIVFDDQQPVFEIEPGHGVERPLAVDGHFFHPGAGKARDVREGHGVKHIVAKARLGLEHMLGIEQEGVAGFAELDGAH